MSKQVPLQSLLVQLIAAKESADAAILAICQHQTFKSQNKGPKIEVGTSATLARISSNGVVPTQGAEMSAVEQQLGAGVQQALGGAHQQSKALIEMLEGAAEKHDDGNG